MEGREERKNKKMKKEEKKKKRGPLKEGKDRRTESG